MTVRGVILGSIAAAALIALGARLVGEPGEFVVLHTRNESGAEFATRMRIVDLGDVTWIRAAGPERDWYQRLVANPRVELERRGRIHLRRAIPEPTPEARLAVDEAFAEKYGLRDRWDAWLARDHAVPIRLIPVAADP